MKNDHYSQNLNLSAIKQELRVYILLLSGSTTWERLLKEAVWKDKQYVLPIFKLKQAALVNNMD